ncbi:glycerol-3-phosphate acyltransferase 5-like [Nymphaea colorata]|nr:glycerol-3-phosphate acyltransferase 5-like [Nymphaea colorata]
MVPRTSADDDNLESEPVVAELEGVLLRDADTFPYFMLMAFEASGLLRFTLLLLSWPFSRALSALGFPGAALRLVAFVALAGLRRSEVELVSRAVLPKFFMDDLDVEAWRAFAGGGRRLVVVTRCPAVMVEWFAREHLRAYAVVGAEIVVNSFGRATGLVHPAVAGDIEDRVKCADVWLGGTPSDQLLVSPCKGQNCAHLARAHSDQPFQPPPVVFHDGRLVPRPTPSTALLILLWFPLGVLLALVRIVVGISLPMSLIPYAIPILGGKLTVRGNLPPPVSDNAGGNGVLFVCTHRTLLDPLALAIVLQRRLTAVTYSLSRLSELLSPIPTVRLTRDRRVDANRIRHELEKGDLVVCPEGTTCREPYLLRFSALFAELTDRIVPVGINYRVGFFHATTARGYKAMDPIFFMMNPRPAYEVAFLDQLPAKLTCAGGKSPYEVANYTQSILGSAMGYKCTMLTRREKYQVLAGNDGSVSYSSYWEHILKIVRQKSWLWAQIHWCGTFSFPSGIKDWKNEIVVAD